MKTILALVWIGLVLGAPIMQGQAKGDLMWVREYAKAGETGNENGLNGDPRFDALLKASFHQGQRFWMDHGSFAPVSEVVHQFIGVPGNMVIDQDRYVTANGCVPHDCNDGGFVWIDTRSLGKPLVLFVATGMVSGDSPNKEMHMHLRVFASRKVNWQRMPPSFMQSFAHWYTAGQVKYLAYKVDMVTIVEPNGQEMDLAPSTFEFEGSPAAQ